MTNFRSFLYALAALLGDVNALKKVCVGRQVGRRLAWRAPNQVPGQLSK